MGSADWMPRNLDKRVEILFPVDNAELKKQVIHILDIQLADNTKAHIMGSDGIYKKAGRRGKKPVTAQMYFCKEAEDRVKVKDKDNQVKKNRVFEPMTAGDVE